MNINKNQKASSIEEAFFHQSGTFIPPTALVDPSVILDEGVKVGPFCVITGNVSIGAKTRLYSNVIIGFPAQHTGTKTIKGTVSIGNNCELREFATIHASKFEDGTTRIGNNCYVMNYCHISHDATLEDNVVLINSVNLAGHVYIEQNVMVMAAAGVHQSCRIGQYAALAPYSGIRQDLPPYCLFEGRPAHFAGLNSIALRRAGITTESRMALKKITKLFFVDKLPLKTIQAHALQEAWWQDATVQNFISFIEKSKRGVSRFINKD